MYEYDVCYVDGDGENEYKAVEAEEWAIATVSPALLMVHFTANNRVAFAVPVTRLVYIHEIGEADSAERVNAEALPTL